MFYFYVLYSLKDNRLYKGATSNLLRRLQQHNAGGNKKGPPKGRAF
jgi:putative endonuclease